jgi:hypothetical protein
VCQESSAGGVLPHTGLMRPLHPHWVADLHGIIKLWSDDGKSIMVFVQNNYITNYGHHD